LGFSLRGARYTTLRTAIWITLRIGNRGEVGRFGVATVGPRLLATQVADRRLRGRRGRLLRISFRATHRASGLLRLTFPGEPAQPELWPVFEGLIAHVFALAENLRDPGDAAAALVTLVNQACVYLMWAEGGWRT